MGSLTRVGNQGNEGELRGVGQKVAHEHGQQRTGIERDVSDVVCTTAFGAVGCTAGIKNGRGSLGAASHELHFLEGCSWYGRDFAPVCYLLGRDAAACAVSAVGCV